MPAKLGLDCKLYYKTGGQASANAWTVLGNAKDVTLSIEGGDADVTTRANNGWKASLATLKSGNIEFEMIYDTTDAGFTAIRTAYFANTIIGLRVLDGLIPASGTNGTQDARDHRGGWLPVEQQDRCPVCLQMRPHPIERPTQLHRVACPLAALVGAG